MKVAPLAKDELKRLETLRNYEILDSLPELDFDDFTKLAAHICGVPIALISLVDESRQWFKSKVGLDAEETPRDLAFCAHAILQDDVFIIPDSFKDERFSDNPLVTGGPQVRFYAGAPLNSRSGHNIGTLCVIDNKPRNLTSSQVEALESLARQVINQMELRISKKQTENLLEIKSSFFANMSHEIRTPLNGVIGFTGLLLDEKLPKKAYEYVNHIKECSESLLMVINDILELSKIDAGKLKVEKVPIHLVKTIENSILTFKAVAAQKNISLTYKIADKVPSIINGDSLRIKQVLLNLIGNAVKFTDNGSISIDVDIIKQIDETNFELIFKVKDSGIGIPQQYIKKLFQPFEQVDNTSTRKYEGTGLGLSICSKIIGLMGGEIWVESVVGEGSTFNFSLTVEKINSSVVEQNINLREVEHLTNKKITHLNILVAEDNELNQKIMKAILKKLGYDDVDFAMNGREATEAVSNKQYDLIFMDIQMPVMDGFEATRIIKQSLNNTCRIVGVSANVFEEDKEKAKKAGMDDYLEKPMDIKKLSKILEELEKEKTVD